MRTSLKALIAASTLAAGIATAPALYAQSTEVTPDTQASRTDQCNTMTQGATMDMKKMMTQMSQMMKTHSKTMQSTMKDHGASHSEKAPSDKE